MESKAFVPPATEATSRLSNLSGSFSSSPVRTSPFVETFVKKDGLEINEKSSSNSSSSSESSDGGSENGGFVSGDEGFESASEPITGDLDEETVEKVMGREEIGVLGSSKFFVPNMGMPVARVSMDDDEEEGGDDVVGGPRVRVLDGEEGTGGMESLGVGADGLKRISVQNVVERKGVSIEGFGDDYGDSVFETPKFEDVIRGNAVVGGETNQISTLILEPADSKIAEPADSSIVEEDFVVGDAEENKNSKIEKREVMDKGSVKLDNKFGQISGHLEEPVNSMSVGDDTNFNKSSEHVTNQTDEIAKLGKDTNVGKDENLPVNSNLIGADTDIVRVETETNGIAETAELGEKIDVFGKGKDEKLDAGAVGGDTVIVDNQEDAKVDACSGQSETADLINSEETRETEKQSEADSQATENESIVKIAADGSMYSGKEAAGNYSKQLEDNLMNDGAWDGLEDELSGKLESPASSNLNSEIKLDEANDHLDEREEEGEEDEIEGLATEEETKRVIFQTEAAKQFLEELEQVSGGGSHSGAESCHDHSQRIDGQIVTDSDEEVDTDEDGDEKELLDSSAITALLEAARGVGESGTITITSQDGSRLFSIERPAGLGSANRSLKPAPRSIHPNIFSPSNLAIGGDSENNLSEEEKKRLEKIQLIRVKFLRLVQRLGHSPEDPMWGQVLYRLGAFAGRQAGEAFSLDAAKRRAMQLEAEGKDLDFSLNMLVLGKSGVGKSATINSLFGEQKTLINAFEPSTTTVKEIIGTIEGVQIRVFDTPGLKSSVMEQGVNRKILSSVKRLMKKCPPDIILYVDRLDVQTRDLNDLPLLRTITSSLGSSIWRSVIVTLTHGASAPPDGSTGSPLSYESYIAQRSNILQHSIGQAVGDLRLMNPHLMNPISLVENHPSCRKNRDGQKVLPNGQSWRPQLLLLSFSMKILSEASALSKPQDPFDHRKLFGFRVRSPPLPYLLSWLLQSRTHPKNSAEQGVDNGDSDIDLDDLSDCDQEEDGDEYDQLPPFKPLRKFQVAKLSKEQRKAYFEEYDYRVKLFQKQQWREELKRMKEMKKKGKIAADDNGYPGEDGDQDNGSPAAVPVPLPDMVLPPSFDCDNPAYRYRYLEPTSQLLTRPVLDTHGWDHDCGYDGVNIEQSLAILGLLPAAVSVQATKDKKEFNIHLDSSVSAKHGENGSTMAGFDIQNIGKQLAYILRGETKFKILKKNKTTAGLSVTFLGENVATGFKVEDQFTLGKRLVLVGSTGTVRCQGDAAYGANMEIRLREADFPIGQDQSTLGLSLVKWRGDLAVGGNLQSQISIGRNSKVAVRVGLNNKMSGQITVKTSSSDKLLIALVGILPVAMAIYKAIFPVSDNYSVI